MDIAIIVVYLVAMVVVGLWAARRASSTEDYRVAGRRLGPLFYTGTMSAVVLGGASTVGGIGLGYTYGISGMWLVMAIATGLLVLSLVFAGRITRLKIYTVSLVAVGGWSGMSDRLDATFFAPDAMGFQSIITMFVIYGFGMLIGQDIWQRVFTARSAGVARWGGTSAAVHVGLYGVAGAVIGMAAAAVLPTLENSDDAFAIMAQQHVPAGLGGVVLAAGVAAMMSTASGALIASATVARIDVVALFKTLVTGQQNSRPSVRGDRLYLLTFGVVVTVFSVLVPDVVTALTIAYDLLVGGLLVAILGGLLWRRGNSLGAAASMAAGSVAVVVGMLAFGVMANAPIYIGLGVSAVVYVVVSLSTRPTDPAVLGAWDRRLAGQSEDSVGEHA